MARERIPRWWFEAVLHYLNVRVIQNIRIWRDEFVEDEDVRRVLDDVIDCLNRCDTELRRISKKLTGYDYTYEAISKPRVWKPKPEAITGDHGD